MYMLQDKKSCKKKNLFQLINFLKKEKYSAIFQFSKNAYRCVFFINSLLYYLSYFHANCQLLKKTCRCSVYLTSTIPRTERNTASINFHIECIDYIVINFLTQIHFQIPVISSYMILPMRVNMEMKTIHMMISSRLHSSFNRTSLFFADLKSCHIGMITWRESGIMSPMSRALWKFVPFP